MARSQVVLQQQPAAVNDTGPRPLIEAASRDIKHASLLIARPDGARMDLAPFKLAYTLAAIHCVYLVLAGKGYVAPMLCKHVGRGWWSIKRRGVR